MEQRLSAIRHSLAHVLAIVVLRRDPQAKLAIGPVTDDGFFYDIQLSEGIILSVDDFPRLEQEMRSVIRHHLPFIRRSVSAEEARELFRENPFKLEIIDGLEKEGQEITVYTTGEAEAKSGICFTDLCAGGHVDNTEEINPDAFALKSVAGAYWRGDEKNPMLTRISGIAFETKESLDAHISLLEEAKKRDHKKLGRELGLFTVSGLVGSGLPLLQPKGAIIRQEIEEFLWDLHKNKGYFRVWTPHIAKENLYILSGHAEKFGDELFRVQGKEEQFFLKPMNCPHHMQLYADNRFSYRDLPVRYFEPATVYRDEKSGQLGGLTRVRAITQDDGHLFCRVTEIEREVSVIVGIIKEFYSVFGMMEGYWVSLSVRGEDRSQYLGDDGAWEAAEKALEDAARSNNLEYRRIEGEAAFYGPKLDFMFKDAIGREWQLSTIQCDFNLPERFDLSFVNENGVRERPVVIHRAISGSVERFMGVMIEHFAGNFPLWLAPLQARILPISDHEHEYATSIYSRLSESGIRADLDDSSESLGKKIRNAKLEKIPYLLVIGKNEVQKETVTLESRDQGKIGEMPLEDAIQRLTQENDSRQLPQSAN